MYGHPGLAAPLCFGGAPLPYGGLGPGYPARPPSYAIAAGWPHPAQWAPYASQMPPHEPGGRGGLEAPLPVPYLQPPPDTRPPRPPPHGPLETPCDCDNKRCFGGIHRCSRCGHSDRPFRRRDNGEPFARCIACKGKG